jgi:predicted amidohydrolase/ribosomal protein S18 acetylase RimI-like enzyme
MPSEKRPGKGNGKKTAAKGGAATGQNPKRTDRNVRRKAPLKLEQFEREVAIRSLRLEDFDDLVALQMACFPGMKPWLREQVKSQLEVFPEGQLCLEYDGTIVASASSLIVDFSEYADWHDWKRVADNGFIRNHDPEGDTLYGIEIMVHPEFQGMRLSRRLYEARKEIARKYNLQRIMIGGRIPGYAAYADNMTAREYAEYVLYKDIYDPVLTAQLANGFILRSLIPGYLKEDSESHGYATQLEWTNLDHRAVGAKQLRAVAAVRVCAVQWQMRALTSFEDFTTEVEFYADVAADYRCDFLLFPELFTLELLSLVQARGPGQAARQLAEYTPQYLNLMTSLALKYHVNIIGGSQFTLEDDCLYNISYLFRRDGTIGKQYKLHITPNERRWWGISPGARQEVFDTDRGKVAINVCYDVEFPELARMAAHRGARLLFVPFNTDEAHGYHRVRYCAQARCIENHMYVAIAGCVGHLPMVENSDIHYAQSAILSPCDIPFGRAGVGSESSANIAQVVLHDVDLELIRRHRQTGTTQNWRDRRTDLYRVVFNDGEETSI